MLEFGSKRVAREHLHNFTPTERDLEHAIATIEDELARAGPILSKR
jgi:hypothetical protein